MASLATKKHFSSMAALRRFTPAVLAEFLRMFPGFVKRHGLTIPTPDKALLNRHYDDIRNACVAEDIEPELNRVLFMASQLGNNEGWAQIEAEMEDRGVNLRFDPASFTLYDLPLMTWMRRKIPEEEDILELSYARVQIHAKSSYRYYAPTSDHRANFVLPTGKVLNELRRELAQHFRNDPEDAGVKVLDYPYDEEIWFLVRYPGQPVRPDAVKHGKADDVSYTPLEYDAIVYNKTFGDLRVNTVRRKDDVAYRVAFGNALLKTPNAFDPNRKIITLDPLKGHCVGLFTVQDAGAYPRVQPIEVMFTEVNFKGRRVTWRASRKDGHLLEYMLPEDPKRLLPGTVDTVFRAKFRYRLKAEDQWHSMTIHEGMDLRFERDGDSGALERWLRERKFIRDVLGVRKVHKST